MEGKGFEQIKEELNRLEALRRLSGSKKLPFTEEDQWKMKGEIPGLYILGEGGVDSGTVEGAYEEAILGALDLQDEENIKKAEAV